MAPPLTLDELRAAVDAGEIDTVLLCLADMQGRLQGKRLMARHFVDDVVSHGAESSTMIGGSRLNGVRPRLGLRATPLRR